ncbi:MAG TPA: adenylyl-sulfate kinase [Puia sp.]|nr:adenylyl-sulfate kinase [Puia sp.]
MIIQFCGLSGSGKTTLARQVQDLLKAHHIGMTVIDGDEYRKTLCAGLGLSKADRNTNIRLLAAEAARLISSTHPISLIAAINPYEDLRREIVGNYPQVKTVFIDCSLEVLMNRDTKGLYRKAMLPDDHPDKIANLTGINDPFERPVDPDLIIHTDKQSVEDASKELMEFILSHLADWQESKLRFSQD